MRMGIVALGLAAVMLTSGCAGGQVSGGGSAPATTPTPTQTSASAVKPALDDLVLSFAGLGPLKIGSDPSAQDPATSIIASEQLTCTDSGTTETVWFANYPDRPLDNAVHAFELGKVGLEGVQTIHIYAAGPKTESGIGVGSTEAELLAAYPTIEQSHDNGLWKDFFVAGDPVNLAFRTSDPNGTGATVTVFGLGPDVGFYGQETVSSEGPVCG